MMKTLKTAGNESEQIPQQKVTGSPKLKSTIEEFARIITTKLSKFNPPSSDYNS